MSRTLVTTITICPSGAKSGVLVISARLPVRKVCSRVTACRWAMASRVPDWLMMPLRSRSHMLLPTTSSCRRPLMDR